MKILAYLNTYRRYSTTLPLALLSLINQTHKPDKIIVFDDNKPEDAKDVRTLEHYNYLFRLAEQRGIPVWYQWGEKKGAHFNHEQANMAGFDLAFFIDDDHVAEPDCLEKLLKEMTPDVGAVGGLILKPPAGPLPNWLKNNKIDEIYNGQNIQWYTWAGKPREVEHLYSSFLYRCNIVHHDLRLSKKVFRGETMFTHSLFLKGYKLIVTPESVTWHFESQTGGCRTPEAEKSNQEMYANDDQIFRDWLSFKKSGKKLFLLNGGLGDHYIFLQVFPLEKDAIYAVCFPEPFKGYHTVSIAEAEKWVDKKDYDVYSWAHLNGWKGTLQEAYKQLYAHINQSR